MTTVWPSTATLAALVLSSSVKNVPSAIVQFSMLRYGGVTAWMRVDQFCAPATICALPDDDRADPAQTRDVLADRVRVGRFEWTALPAPGAPPLLRVLPGSCRSNRLVPSPAERLLATEALAPSPRATMVMTAPTPMMIPSVVRRCGPCWPAEPRTPTASLQQPQIGAPRRRRLGQHRIRIDPRIREPTGPLLNRRRRPNRLNRRRRHPGATPIGKFTASRVTPISPKLASAPSVVTPVAPGPPSPRRSSPGPAQNSPPPRRSPPWPARLPISLQPGCS